MIVEMELLMKEKIAILEIQNLILITNGQVKFVSHVIMIMAGFVTLMDLVQQTNVVMITKEDLKNASRIMVPGITVVQKPVHFEEAITVKVYATLLITLRQSVGTGSQLETKNVMMATQKQAMVATLFVNQRKTLVSTVMMA